MIPPYNARDRPCVAALDTMLHFTQSGKFRQCPGSSFPHEGRSPSWAPLKYNFYTKGFVCMKNITKAIALCLALLLCLSFPISASAVEQNVTTIDTETKGSLTIYKVDLTNAEKDGVWDSSYVSTGVYDQDVYDALIGATRAGDTDDTSDLGNGENSH